MVSLDDLITNKKEFQSDDDSSSFNDFENDTEEVLNKIEVVQSQSSTPQIPKRPTKRPTKVNDSEQIINSSNDEDISKESVNELIETDIPQTIQSQAGPVIPNRPNRPVKIDPSTNIKEETFQTVATSIPETSIPIVPGRPKSRSNGKNEAKHNLQPESESESESEGEGEGEGEVEKTPVIPSRPYRSVLNQEASKSSVTEDKIQNSEENTHSNPVEIDELVKDNNQFHENDIKEEAPQSANNNDVLENYHITQEDKKDPKPSDNSNDHSPDHVPSIPSRRPTRQIKETFKDNSKNDEPIGEIVNVIQDNKLATSKEEIEEKVEKEEKEEKEEIEEIEEKKDIASTVDNSQKSQIELDSEEKPEAETVIEAETATEIITPPIKSKESPSAGTQTNDVSDLSSGESVSSSNNTKGTPIPVIPARPRPQLSRNSTSEDKQKAKGPPPIPKKPSSKIAAFQEMLRRNQEEQSQLQQPYVPSRPRTFDRKHTFEQKTQDSNESDSRVESKISNVSTGGLNSNFRKNLNNLFALPGMVNPQAEIPAAISNSLNESEEDLKKDEDDSNIDKIVEPVRDSRKSRAKGPRGKRLPTSTAQKVEVEDKRIVKVFDIWSSGSFNKYSEGFKFGKLSEDGGSREIQAEDNEKEQIEEITEKVIENPSSEKNSVISSSSEGTDETNAEFNNDEVLEKKSLNNDHQVIETDKDELLDSKTEEKDQPENKTSEIAEEVKQELTEKSDLKDSEKYLESDSKGDLSTSADDVPNSEDIEAEKDINEAYDEIKEKVDELHTKTNIDE